MARYADAEEEIALVLRQLLPPTVRSRALLANKRFADHAALIAQATRFVTKQAPESACAASSAVKHVN
jgi:hypothetical protein